MELPQSLEEVQKNFDKLKKTQNINVQMADIERVYLKGQLMAARTIKEVHYNNETKEMTIVYNDKSSRVYFGVEITDIAMQESPGRDSQAEIVYNFAKYMDDFGKYVDNFEEGE